MTLNDVLCYENMDVNKICFESDTDICVSFVHCSATYVTEPVGIFNVLYDLLRRVLKFCTNNF